MGDPLYVDRPDLIPLVRAAYAAKGWPIFKGPFNLNVFGVRNASRVRGQRDDAICVLYEDARGELRLQVARGSVDPGLEGIGIMKPGRYPGLWSAGPGDLHKGRYRAFCQRGACTIIFDRDGDDELDVDGPTGPGAGYNMHHDYDEELLRASTLGCWVVRRAVLAALLGLVDAQAARVGPSGKSLGYRVSPGLFDAATDRDLAPLLDAARVCA